MGCTEAIPDSLNPKFMKSFVFTYNRTKEFVVRLVIYDVDDFTELATNLSAHDYIGECEFLLNDVLCPRPKTLQREW